jgi:hypothetical protein
MEELIPVGKLISFGTNRQAVNSFISENAINLKISIVYIAISINKLRN